MSIVSVFLLAYIVAHPVNVSMVPPDRRALGNGDATSWALRNYPARILVAAVVTFAAYAMGIG